MCSDYLSPSEKMRKIHVVGELEEGNSDIIIAVMMDWRQ